MREIAFDTETTGLDPHSGHRIVEIGCVEMYGRIKTGKYFHTYLNPDRDMPEEAYRVHGISGEFLKDKPRFTDRVDAMLAFIDSAPLVIHNASFDLRFLSAEMQWAGRTMIDTSATVDTVVLARQKFPGAPASLDALCRRFNIDLTAREKHGALLDAELLADVYLELTGGSQSVMLLANAAAESAAGASVIDIPQREPLVARSFPPTAEEMQAHFAFLAAKIKQPLWAVMEEEKAS